MPGERVVEGLVLELVLPAAQLAEVRRRRPARLRLSSTTRSWRMSTSRAMTPRSHARNGPMSAPALDPAEQQPDREHERHVRQQDGAQALVVVVGR